MTTFTLLGQSIYYGETDQNDVIGLAAQEMTFTFDGTVTALDYETRYSYAAGEYIIRLDPFPTEFSVGDTFYGQNDVRIEFYDLTWGNGNQSQILLFELADYNQGFGHHEFLLEVSGDSLPEFSSVRDLMSFMNSVTEMETIMDDRSIPLSSFDDISYGTDAVNINDGEESSLLNGGSGDDLIHGNGGNDTIYAGDGSDTVSGGAGNDVIYGGATEADLRDVIYGGDGDDFIDGGYGNDELRGDAGNDTINGGYGADTVIGGAGNDVLTGGTWGDALFGGDGDDFLNGGFGHDRLNGGAGADRFYHLGVEGHGSDWVQDYDAAEGDTLVFGGTGASADDFQVNFTETANAGTAGVEEAFVIYRPTGQILWALVDGAAQDQINLSVNGATYDLLA
ncbi:calcium-binding protein [Pseudooceanicola sp. 502str34]